MSASYFGDEPTCARCDYPRRLHHLLNVSHDYDATNEEGPAAVAPANGAEESTNHEEEGSTMNDTHTDADVARYLDKATQVLADANAYDLDVPAPHWHIGPMPVFETCDLLTDPPTSHRLFERVLAGAGADVIVEAEDRLQGGRLHRQDATISVDCGVDLTSDQARSLAARLLAAADLIEDRPVRRDEDAIRTAAELREGLA